MPAKKKRRVFSLKEANALLPELAQRLKRLQHKKEIYSRTHDTLFLHELVCVAEKSRGFSEPHDNLESGIQALEKAIEDLAEDVEMIFATGAILRSIERGRVDLLGEMDGQKIFFSWEAGEPEIRFYRVRGGATEARRELPVKMISER